MYIVTGGAGFIGSNIVAGLNARGRSDVMVVDNLKNSTKFLNIRDLNVLDFMDKREFREQLRSGAFDNVTIDAIFHQGACSDTMEYDGVYMMDNNFTYSKELFNFATKRRIPFIYASSAATYGDSTTFVEHPDNENPLNVYGYSKLLFDRYVEQHLEGVDSAVAGLRYFNVYGPREVHKGRMASMSRQLCLQLSKNGVANLFQGSGGYGDGEQRRDFIYVGDCVNINLFLAEERRADGLPFQGIYNVGTGQSRSFNDIAQTLIKILGKGKVEYKPMPEVLQDKYQNFTEADITRLKSEGYDRSFTPLEEGLAAYVTFLQEHHEV